MCSIVWAEVGREVDKNRLPKRQADKRLFGRLAAFRFKRHGLSDAESSVRHDLYLLAAGLSGFVATGGGCFIEAV